MDLRLLVYFITTLVALLVHFTRFTNTCKPHPTDTTGIYLFPPRGPAQKCLFM